MPDHICFAETAYSDAFYALEKIACLDKPRLLAGGKIDLGYISGDHRLGIETDPGQEHFHLFGRGVLGLIEDNECIVQCPPAHERQGRNFYDAALDEPGVHDAALGRATYRG